jgi:hypothetical protein
MFFNSTVAIKTPCYFIAYSVPPAHAIVNQKLRHQTVIRHREYEYPGKALLIDDMICTKQSKADGLGQCPLVMALLIS